MPHVELKYGHGSVALEVEGGRFEVLAGGGDEAAPLTDAEIGAAIDDPIDSQPLEEIVSPGESALVVVSDATRATGSASIVHLLVRRLVQLGVAPYDLKVIFATGIHRRVSAAERRELLTPFVVQRVRSLDHDAHDPARHVSLGLTERGTPVEINRALLDFSHVVLTGGVGFHYFAGFTGGRKSVCPGLASARAIEATHLLALDPERGGRRAGVGIGRLDGNAVHEECERIAAEVAPSFLVNAVVDEAGRPVRVYAGDWRAAHRLACAEYADSHAVKIPARRPLVVVSAGGSPHDLNLIQAHKALDMASHACEEGGTIILLAECSDGLGRPDFLKWFDARDSRELERRLLSAYEVNGQTAWSLLTKAERFRVHLVSSLPGADVRLMRMRPAPSLEDALAQAPAGADGYVMPRGAAFLPVVGGAAAGAAEAAPEPGVH